MHKINKNLAHFQIQSENPFVPNRIDSQHPSIWQKLWQLVLTHLNCHQVVKMANNVQAHIDRLIRVPLLSTSSAAGSTCALVRTLSHIHRWPSKEGAHFRAPPKWGIFVVVNRAPLETGKPITSRCQEP